MEYLNLNHLKHFYTAAKLKSYTEAAKVLYVNQPAVSKSVKALEVELGVQLFQKVGRNIELTRDGEYIYTKCDDIFSQVDTIRNFSKDIDLPLKKTIELLSDDVIATCLFPKCFKEMTSSLTDVRPVVTTGRSEELLPLLKKKKNALGFFFHHSKLPQGLIVYKKLAVSHTLIISREHFNSMRVRTSFIGSKEVHNAKNNSFPTVKKMRKKWAQTQIRYSSNNLLFHKEMVLQGLGVAILPTFLVANELKNGTLKDLLPSENFVFNLKVVKTKELPLNGAMKELISCIQSLVN
jgi:DNA-binding transcriptional LysR family regulator